MDTLTTLMQPLLATAFTLWGSPVSWLEVLGFGLAVAMVLCNMRIHPAGWPLAIVSSLLYFELFRSSKLYGDAALQIFFVVLALWGWWQWLRGTDERGAALQVRPLPRALRLRVIGLTALAWPALALFLDHYTDTDVPWWDAFPTTLSLCGQWLLGRKYIENWPTWIVVNLASVGLFAYKGLWLTVLLYALFVLMAAMGWRAWRQRAPRLATA